MRISTDSSVNLHNSREGWKRAITDAEAEIARARGRIYKLRESIRIFKKKLEAGEPWPGSDSVSKRSKA